MKKNDTFGDLDNVFSNVSGTSNQNIQNNANSKLNNNNSSLSNQGAGFDFDKFNFGLLKCDKYSWFMLIESQKMIMLK